jgi:hypothetical protein
LVIDRDRTDGGLSRAPVSRCSLSNRARRRGFRGPEKKPPQPWEAVIGMLWEGRYQKLSLPLMRTYALRPQGAGSSTPRANG